MSACVSELGRGAGGGSHQEIGFGFSSCRAVRARGEKLRERAGGDYRPLFPEGPAGRPEAVPWSFRGCPAVVAWSSRGCSNAVLRLPRDCPAVVPRLS